MKLLCWLFGAMPPQSICRIWIFPSSVSSQGFSEKRPFPPKSEKKSLTALYLTNTDPVHKISIIPTAKGALGYTMQMPEEDQYLISEEELRSRMAVMLGGRAAELVVFGVTTTGASNDLARVSMLARRMVTEFGMSKKLGPVRYSNPEGAYLETYSTNRSDLSQNTLSEIDEEIRELVNEAQNLSITVLSEHREVLDMVAETLQQKEVIMGDELKRLAASVETENDRIMR